MSGTTVVIATLLTAYSLRRVRVRVRLPTRTNPLRCLHRAPAPLLTARGVDQSLQAVSPD